MFSLLTLLSLTTAALAAPAASSGPPAGQVSIAGIVYGGSGCPQGTVGSYVSDDKQTFTLIFDNFVASIGPGVSVTENRKNCQINLNLNYPSGFQYSIFNTMYRGYVGIDAGVTARQESTFYFSGQSAQCSTSTLFNGPRSGDYAITDSLPMTSTVWSPCGSSAALNINSQVRLTSSKSGASGLITDDSIDGKIKFVVGLQWQTC